MDVSKRNELYIQVDKIIKRHCLPPGYIFKKKGEKAADNDEDKETFEEEIDNRIKLLGDKKGTKVTIEMFIKINRFLEWKEKKRVLKEI